MSLSGRSSALAGRYGPGELRVMECVWRDAPADVRTVHSVLVRHGSEVAYSTVKTIMERLAIKGELSRERDGRQFIYAPVRTRSETEALVTQGVVEELLDRHGDLAVSFFVDRARQDPAQLARLRRMLREMEAEDGDG